MNEYSLVYDFMVAAHTEQNAQALADIAAKHGLDGDLLAASEAGIPEPQIVTPPYNSLLDRVNAATSYTHYHHMGFAKPDQIKAFMDDLMASGYDGHIAYTEIISGDSKLPAVCAVIGDMRPA